MRDLGPLFGRESVDGPICINYFVSAGVHYYLIGERHTSRERIDTDVSRDAIEQIKRYTEKHRTFCYVEATENYFGYCLQRIREIQHESRIPMSEITSAAPTAIACYAGHYLTQGFSSKLTTVFSDIRRTSPYDMWMLMHDPYLYIVERYEPSERQAVTKKVLSDAKQVEKLIFRHIATRAAAKEFLRSLCVGNYPAWFVALYKSVHDVTDEPPALLNDKMRELQERNADAHRCLVAHMNYYYDNWAVSPYSLAMKRAQSMRQTAAADVVADIYTDAKDIFIEMTSFLLDIFVLLDLMLTNRSRGDTVIVLSGAAHTENITRFFSTYVTNDIVSKASANGRLPSGPALESFASLPKPAKELLVKMGNKPRHRRA